VGVGGDQRCVNAENAKLRPVCAKIVKKRASALMSIVRVADG